MHICYITTVVPYGTAETFILHEIDAVQRQGHSVEVIPIRPEDALQTPGYRVWHCRALGGACLGLAVKFFLRHPLRSITACAPMLFRAGGFKKALKNLYFFPKALATAAHLQQEPAGFIHAHWLATTASVAYIASRLTGIPWGATGHRWDIYEHNALGPKFRTTAFIRTIDQRGAAHLRGLAPQALAEKIHVVHMGIHPEASPRIHVRPPDRPLRLCMPANLVAVKGHRFVLEAFRLLLEQGFTAFTCIFAGDGELRAEIDAQIRRYGLSETVQLAGHVPNRELLDAYRRGEVDLVLLPSLELSDSEHEGIPVSLMEAMACGIPVLATATGGIPELLRDGAGLLIPQQDPRALADAIRRMAEDGVLYRKTAEKGLARVQADFDYDRNIQSLLELMAPSPHEPQDKEERRHA